MRGWRARYPDLIVAIDHDLVQVDPVDGIYEEPTDFVSGVVCFIHGSSADPPPCPRLHGCSGFWEIQFPVGFGVKRGSSLRVA